jgi:pyruvate formate lyase activating enzyme
MWVGSVMRERPFSIPAKYFEQHPSGKVRCTLCPTRCLIAEGEAGVCGSRQVKGGVLEACNWGLVVSAAVDPIEKKPLYHFHPSSGVMSFGGLGCNMRCLHCQNFSISGPKVTDMDQPDSEPWEPGEAVEMAIKKGTDGIAFTYNEPTIWFEWALETCRIAKAKELYTVFVTNAYIEKEPLDEIGPFLDAYAADIKGWGQEFYTKFSSIPKWESILEAIDRAKNVHGMHVEVTTNMVPGWNDDENSVSSIAKWVFEKLGPLAPWHISRFTPLHKLSHLNPTPSRSLVHAREIGLEVGLKYVFIGNVHGMEGVEDSRCWNCNSLLISRAGYFVKIVGLKGRMCTNCGADTGIVN